MTEELSRGRAVRPTGAETTLLRVVRVRSVSPTFVRVTFVGVDDTLKRTFAPMGYDQWFRLFLPDRPDEVPQLPGGGVDGWYARWLAMDETDRAVVRNYTVRATTPTVDGWEIDVDFVVHHDPATGHVDGVAGRWASQARPGMLVGFLDQGTMFSTDQPEGQVVVVADETGIPAAEGISRSLAADQPAAFVLEIPAADDRRELPSTAAVQTRWAVRHDGARTGSAALAELAGIQLGPSTHVFAVGEASFALQVRDRAQRAGVPKSSVDFCAYWRSRALVR